MQFYIQLDDGYITDAITYEYGDYIPVELETPLPDGFIGGAYKYLGGGTYELDETRVKGDAQDIETLAAHIAAQDATIQDMSAIIDILGGKHDDDLN